MSAVPSLSFVMVSAAVRFANREGLRLATNKKKAVVRARRTAAFSQAASRLPYLYFSSETVMSILSPSFFTVPVTEPGLTSVQTSP